MYNLYKIGKFISDDIKVWQECDGGKWWIKPYTDEIFC